jgi:DNA-binding Lrp family transcriptional regulator
MTAKDEELIGLLKVNAREPVASLARKLGVSRTTIQDRLRRLEQTGVIEGYSVRLGKSGKFDLVALVTAKASEDMDKLLDRFSAMKGVTDIETAVILSTKLDRR